MTVAKPIENEVVEWDEYTGRLDAVEFVELRARVGGLIVSAPFKEGSIVQKGDLLVEIDVQPFQAALDVAASSADRAAAQLDLATIEFNRIKSIPRDSRSPTEFDTAVATMKQAQAELAGAKANLVSARLNVEWCRVTAPITGRVSRKFVTEGNLITGGTGSGTLLTTITSVDPIYCYIDADERAVLKYERLAAEGKRASARQTQIPCFLQLADGTVYPHQGIVDFVDNRLDPSTGTIMGRAVFPNVDGLLTPGLFARARVPGSGRYKALLVPDSAVVTDQTQKLLLVVGPDDIAHMRAVKLGPLFGELRSIESGITLDDRVIINGLMQAREGEKVTPHPGEISKALLPLTAPDWPASPSLVSTESDSIPARTSEPTTTRSAP